MKNIEKLFKQQSEHLDHLQSRIDVLQSSVGVLVALVAALAALPPPKQYADEAVAKRMKVALVKQASQPVTFG